MTKKLAFGAVGLLMALFLIPSVSSASAGLTPDQSARIRADLAIIKSLGFESIRVLTFTKANDPAYANWPQSNFLSFPTPTAHELENLKEFFKLIDDAGLSYEVVLLMPDSHGLYYQNGVTGDDYKKFIDALWTVIWSGKLNHLYVGGDLSLDAPTVDTQNPYIAPNGQEYIANHRRWIGEIWPYVSAKCPGCNVGIELDSYSGGSSLSLWGEGAASARWIRSNLTPQPGYLGFQLYPTTHAELQYLGFEKNGVVNWQALAQDWLSGVVAAAGSIPVTVDEIGLNLASVAGSQFTAQDQQDFLTQALPYFNTNRVPFNVWEFADHLGIGLYGLMTQNRIFRPTAQAIQATVAAARDLGLYPGIQYIPPESDDLAFIMPGEPTVSLTANGQSDLKLTTQGETYTLEWSSSNVSAESCPVVAYAADGTKTGGFWVESNAAGSGWESLVGSYTITCTSEGGTSVSKSVTITAVAAPPTLAFTVATSTSNPTDNLIIVTGDSFTLTWNSSNVSGCTLMYTSSDRSRIDVPWWTITPNGAGTDIHAGSYTIQCTGTDGTTVPKTVTITAVAPTPYQTLGNIVPNPDFALWTSEPASHWVQTSGNGAGFVKGSIADSWYAGPGPGGTYGFTRGTFGATQTDVPGYPTHYGIFDYVVGPNAGSTDEYGSAPRAPIFEHGLGGLVPFYEMAGHTWRYTIYARMHSGTLDVAPALWLSTSWPGWLSGQWKHIGDYVMTWPYTYRATSDGITGTTTPSGVAADQFDGGVHWQFVGRAKGRQYDIYESGTSAGGIYTSGYSGLAHQGATCTITTVWTKCSVLVSVPTAGYTNTSDYVGSGEDSRTLLSPVDSSGWGGGPAYGGAELDFVGRLPRSGDVIELSHVSVTQEDAPQPNPGPTAILTASVYGGIASTSITVKVGDPVDYAWSSTNGISYDSTYSTEAPACGTGSGPYEWGVANTPSGTLHGGPIASCQAGHTYTLKYIVTGGSQTAVATVTVHVTAQVPPTPTPLCPASYSDVTVTGATSGGVVWGSGPYTDDSNVAMVAVHAGLITAGQSAVIHRTPAGSASSYVGSTRNGVITYDWNRAWCGVTPSIVSSTPPPPSSSCLTSHPEYYSTIQVTGKTTGNVWGSGPYTGDSDTGAAAVHAGLISVGQTATIQRTDAGELNSFTGSFANGVQTRDWNTNWCAVTYSM